MPSLESIGFSTYFKSQLIDTKSELTPMRVFSVHRNQYQLMGENGEAKAVLSGRLGYVFQEPAEFPTVGDWVLARHGGDGDLWVIERVMDRQTKISRRHVGGSSEEQLIAANVDIGFIVQSCNHDLNPRRLERYILALEHGGVRPVIILNKADLTADRNSTLQSLGNLANNYTCIFTDALVGEGMADVQALVNVGQTAVFIGSSGVGKSTIINQICPSTHQATQDISEHLDKGRHTTTSRKVFEAKDGGLVIDTPGMREFGLIGTEIETIHLFSDIDEFAKSCRYRDCSHAGEPGCAVLQAIAEGRLDAESLKSMQKLQKEEAYEKRRHDVRLQSNAKKRWKAMTKQIRQTPKKQ